MRPRHPKFSAALVDTLISLTLIAGLMPGAACTGLLSTGPDGDPGDAGSSGGSHDAGSSGGAGDAGGARDAGAAWDAGGAADAGGASDAGAAADAGGTVSPGACPANAYFCSGFEEASGLPQGATFEDPDESGGGTTFDKVMTLDKTAPYDGAQSLKVTSPDGFSFRMVGVAVPTNSFWVRLFVKSDQDIGQDGHNAFFQAMTDPNYHNSTHSVEVAEQFTCVLLNEHDALFPSGNTCGANKALAKDTWHCMEAKFDGTTGDVQVYADKTLIVDATGWASAKAAFNTFEFGFAYYHGPARSIWYDDVVVAPERVGCP